MEIVLGNIIDAIIPVAITSLAGFLGWVGNQIRKHYEEKAKNEIIRNIISSTVKYVEQVYKDIHGPEKLEEAKQVAYSWLKEKGIEIGDAELTILIESFVNGLNSIKE